MKVTLNLTQLLEQKKITPAEFAKFQELAKLEATSHAYYVLIVLAAIAVALGFFGLAPDIFWQFVKAIFEALGRVGSHLLIIGLLVYGGSKINSAFLIGLSAFVILSLLGGSTFYSHASYFVAIQEPALTVFIFSLLAVAALQFSKSLNFDGERLVLIFARTCLIIVNMGFWIGSLWGSKLFEAAVPRCFFAVFWAVGIIAVGAWGAREGRRFVVNTCAVFGSIHFYTQWFELLGASPGSLLIAGLLALGILYGIRQMNKQLFG